MTDLRLMASICLVAALGCWAAYGAQALIVPTYRRAYVVAAASRPLLVNGAVLDLDDYVRPKLSFTGSQRFLLFVTSDTCPWCNAELGEWQDFLGKAPLKSTSVVLLSFDGMKIPNAIARVLSVKEIPYQKALIVNATGFTGQTGISATPEIIATDSGMRVRLLSARLTETLQRQIVAWASGVSLAAGSRIGGNYETQ